MNYVDAIVDVYCRALADHDKPGGFRDARDSSVHIMGLEWSRVV